MVRERVTPKTGFAHGVPEAALGAVCLRCLIEMGRETWLTDPQPTGSLSTVATPGSIRSATSNSYPAASPSGAFAVAPGIHVCGTCYCLYGRTDRGAQLCRCASSDEHEALAKAARRKNHDGWIRSHELCRCCGASLVDASTKWARWFCGPCLERAVEVNRACGSCVIPIGYHSMVNGVFRYVNRCKTLPGATAFADQLNAFFRESGSVWEWGLTVIARHWARAGLPPGTAVPVDTYLTAVDAAGVDCQALFDELVAARGIPSNWPDFAAIPLELILREADSDGTLEAFEEIVWTYPDGEDNFAELRLSIAPHRGGWEWAVTVDAEAAGENGGVLATGANDELRRAKSDGEAAAQRLIDERGAGA